MESLARRRLLIVDDEPGFLRTMENAFVRYNRHVEIKTCEDGIQAFRGSHARRDEDLSSEVDDACRCALLRRRPHR